MITYNEHLKQYSQKLRTSQTDAEQLLWSRLRRKQICGIQFNRQKPLGGYIVDFYSYKAKLVIELDGSQHYEPECKHEDETRDSFLDQQGLKVLRFNNLQVLQELEAVVTVIFNEVACRIEQSS